MTDAITHLLDNKDEQISKLKSQNKIMRDALDRLSVRICEVYPNNYPEDILAAKNIIEQILKEVGEV